MREARAQVVTHKFPDTEPGCSKYSGSGPFPNFSPSRETPGCNGERKPHVLNVRPEGQGKLRDPVPAQPVCFAWTISSISLPTLTFVRCCQTDPRGVSDGAWLHPPPRIALLAKPMVGRELQRGQNFSLVRRGTARLHLTQMAPLISETSSLPRAAKAATFIRPFAAYPLTMVIRSYKDKWL